MDVSAFPAVDAGLLRAAVLRAVAADDGAPAEISLTLLDDAAIGELNARWLEREGPTDVIAFALGDGPDLVGDVYLGVEQARRQAEEHGVPLEEELARLAIHGTLHVLGHDHPEGPDRLESPMFRLQERVLEDLLRTPRPGEGGP